MAVMPGTNESREQIVRGQESECIASRQMYNSEIRVPPDNLPPAAMPAKK